MAQTLICLGWLLIAGGAVVLLVSPWIPPSVFEPFKNAVPAGVLIGLGGTSVHTGTSGKGFRGKEIAVLLGFVRQSLRRGEESSARPKQRSGYMNCGRPCPNAREGTLYPHHG